MKIGSCYECPCSVTSLTTVLISAARMCKHPSQVRWSDALQANIGSIVRDGSILPAGCPLRRAPLVLEPADASKDAPQMH